MHQRQDSRKRIFKISEHDKLQWMLHSAVMYPWRYDNKTANDKHSPCLFQIEIWVSIFKFSPFFMFLICFILWNIWTNKYRKYKQSIIMKYYTSARTCNQFSETWLYSFSMEKMFHFVHRRRSGFILTPLKSIIFKNRFEWLLTVANVCPVVNLIQIIRSQRNISDVKIIWNKMFHFVLMRVKVRYKTTQSVRTTLAHKIVEYMYITKVL